METFASAQMQRRRIGSGGFFRIYPFGHWIDPRPVVVRTELHRGFAFLRR